MRVAEKDPAVHGLLEEERRRCLEVLASLRVKAEEFPKGALNVRKKSHKGKEYRYHYLVLREGGRVVNRHVPEHEVLELRSRLEQRDRYRKEILVYQRRIAYLERLLDIPANRRGGHGKPA